MNNSKLTAISLSTIILLGYTQPVQALNTTSEATISSGSITENLNDKGKITVSKDTTAPAQFQITKNNWDGAPNYIISMQLWYGTNGDVWKLYENGALLSEIPLVNNSPNAQSAQYTFTDKPNDTYVYTAELVNSVGVTKGKTSVTHEVTKNEKPINIELPTSASGEPAVGYKILQETDSTFEWAVFIANPNKGYIWEGKEFSAWGLNFDTDHEITSVSNCSSFKQEGKKVTIDLKQDERLFPYSTTRVFKVKGNKKNITNPTNFKPNIFRGNLTYPKYQGLPASWEKTKSNLNENDLIANKADYYKSTVEGKTGNMLMYSKPAHATQIQLGLPNKMPVPVNGVKGLKIWMPSEYLAMGIGTGTEFFGLNPNFMIGLSIKENFTCGLAPIESGYNENITTVDGKQWSWPIQKKHPDGPFQQEKPNFNEIKKQYPDYLAPSAEHEKYVTLKTGDPDDPSYVHSAMSSYMSLTMTRELLYAIPNNKFDEFLAGSKDPWAEFVLVDNAYNRGVYGLLQRNLFTTHRNQAINTTDLNKEFDLGGFASHIETIKSVITEMDNETNTVYDAKITWPMMENYLNELRLYYGNGTPSDPEWIAMKTDVKRSFDILSKHWGSDTISYRYDFLTLLRVAEEYLPKNKQPAPSSSSWIEQINSANNQAATSPK
ncbi:hypothetical protein [Clostridium gasigenes]|uniref:hypothetical protein n=1 Tax=Clostridium gasigenes TaxID=94869 RepID=UPI001C0DD32E|nr:hypothetical protein [Clostridium gasigenes]MBU3107385.1 hypothetical protein [Clostridium gasigenes]